MPNDAAYPCGIQFFCITPIQAALNDFWGLSRHLSRLDKPQKSLNTIRDRGDTEAPSAGISQPEAGNATHHPAGRTGEDLQLTGSVRKRPPSSDWRSAPQR